MNKKLKAYGIFKYFKNGKIQKSLPVGPHYNYELVIPEKDKEEYAIIGIGGSELYYYKSGATRVCEELNKLWGEEVFKVHEIEMIIKI